MKDGSVILSGVRSTKSKNLAVTMLACFISVMFVACSGDGSTNASDIHSGISSDSKVGSSFNYGEMTDDRDGQVYKTVTIGNQTWMAENLNYAYTGVKYLYEDGRYTSDSTSWCYENEPDSCAKYGRLYTWSAAMDSAAVFSETGRGCGYEVSCNAASIDSKIQVRGVCPQGWHLPFDAEWEELFTAVGGMDSAGVKLKSTSGWLDDGDGLDSYGFGVLPAGLRYLDGLFNYAGDYAYFWSSTEFNSYYACRWSFLYDYENVRRYDNGKSYGYSVRCLKD
ncbi:fibrobacter succinogenes major paralogous domain-containing protein [Fibrobacter sp. UWEL]|uniref:fibrobacter succinogenes major paralogous domain-containing protein n=1 Tax=Fibrobacter sp. UWEL TaxID=1896209 RepID=UPI00091BBC71|nr:fibrobacter succinogenes major paralogous domain-containing protein [Fibrobacter sp. UWEL]SHL38589.1 major paralogous domain-containing protein [Fibrobacter sp. UWEL]